MDTKLTSHIPEMRRPDLELRLLDGVGVPTQLHAHPFYEIYFFLEGTMERYVVGGKSYRLHPGDILMLPPGVPHHPVFSGQPRQYRRYLLWLSEAYLQLLGRADPEILQVLHRCKESQSYRIRCKAGARKVLENILASMWQEEQGNALCRTASLYGSCMGFLVQLNRFAADENAPMSGGHHADAQLEQVLTYIHEHYTENITLQQVAEQFFTSPSGVELLLRRKVGKPFYRYVTECRIIHAQTLIAGGMPLKEVGIACGYNDYSNFYRAFTGAVGISPSQFRQHLPTSQYQAASED